MSYLVLARKYRPQTFEDVVGQEHVTRTLTNAIASGRAAHALLFAGQRGTGKTTVARIFAKAMNCVNGPTPTPCNACQSCREITAGNAADVFEIDGASNNSVDQVRELRDNIRYMPAHSKYKIYIIDEVHMLSNAAFNALLKTLEEPPAHVMFLFATTEPQKIPITILSRCQRHDLRRISLAEVVGRMAGICRTENFIISDESLGIIAREAGGSMRDALSLLDLVISCTPDNQVSDEGLTGILGIVDRRMIFDLAAALLAGKVPDLLDLIENMYSRGHDLKKVYEDLIEHFRNLLIVRMGRNIERLVDVPAHEIEAMRRQTGDVTEIRLSQMLDLLFREEVSVRLSAHPRIAMEMAVIRAFQIKPALSIDMLIEKLDVLQKSMMQGEGIVAPPPEPDPGFNAQADDPGQGLHEKQAPYIAETEIPSVKKPASSETEMPGGSISPESAADNPPADDGPPSDNPVFTPDADPAQIWNIFRKITTRKHPSLGPLLNAGEASGRSDGVFQVTFKVDPFSSKLIEKKKETLGKCFREHTGDALRLEIVIARQDNGGRQKPLADSRIKQAALKHPLVADAIELFEGSIVDVKIMKEE